MVALNNVSEDEIDPFAASLPSRAVADEAYEYDESHVVEWTIGVTCLVIAVFMVIGFEI